MKCCTCVRAKPIAAALPCLALIDALLQPFMAHQLSHPALPHVCRRVRSQACSQVSDAGLKSSSGYGETPLSAAAHRIRSVSSARRGESGAADAQKAKITDLRVRPRVAVWWAGRSASLSWPVSTSAGDLRLVLDEASATAAGWAVWNDF